MTIPAGSPYNERRVKRRVECFPERVLIQDITLREGQQAADVALSVDEKVEIALRLEEAGVEYIQVGFAGGDDADVAALRAAGIGMRLGVLVVAFRDGWREAIASASEAGADVLQVLVRTADSQLRAMGMSREDGKRQVRDVIEYATGYSSTVWFVPSFVTLADEHFLRALYREARAAGARHFDITDTTGIAKPEAIQYLVDLVKEETNGGAVGVHCHNDFGLAVANSIAGLQAGADGVDVTINGYGERAGNCPLDEIVLALEVLYRRNTGIHLDRLMELDQYASRVTRIPIPSSKPISGSNVFAQKLDIHVQLTTKDPGLLEPYPPDLVGNRRTLSLGIGTGPIAVAAKMASLGLPEPSPELAAQLVHDINNEAMASRSQVSDHRFLRLVGNRVGSAVG